MKVLRWARSHPRLALALSLLLLFGVVNVLAYRHARAMTHFVPGAGWKPRPDALTLGDKVRALFSGLAVPRPRNASLPDAVGLDYEVHTFAGDAGRLEAWHVPHAQARGVVVMHHGYAASKAALLHEAAAFHEMGYACFLVDFRGSGGSGGDETTIGYREADDVARAVGYVRGRWPGRPVVLFGQSMGSAAILRALAVHKVRVDAAVLECPFDRLLTTVQARFGLVGVPSFPSAQILMFWGSVQLGIDTFAHNPVEYAHDVACPVLLLLGRNDCYVTCDQIRAIRDRLPGGRDLHLFAGLGHESYVSRKPGEWKECVGQFLDRADRALVRARPAASHP